MKVHYSLKNPTLSCPEYSTEKPGKSAEGTPNNSRDHICRHVFGPYDVLCSIRARDREDLEKVISIIHKNVPNIEGAMTTIVADQGLALAPSSLGANRYLNRGH